MAQVRSARGDVVNFELIAIKQQLASAPTPKSVEDRRRFIDEKDGIRTTRQIDQNVDALALSIAAAGESAAAKSK